MRPWLVRPGCHCIVSHLPIVGTKLLRTTTPAKKGLFRLIIKVYGHTIVTGTAWRQKHEVAGYIAAIVRKQRDVHAGIT